MKNHGKSLAKSLLFASLAAAVLATSACNNNNSTPPFTGGFRAVNGVADSNSSGLTVDISNISSQVQNVKFGTASQISDVPEGSYDSQATVNGVTFQVSHIVLSHNSVTTVFTLGKIGAGGNASTATGFPVQESLSAPPSGQFVVQYVNDSASHPGVNVYLVAPGSSINGINPTASLTTAAPASQAAAINNGRYEIVITDATTGTVIFDSGHGNGGVSLPNVSSSTNANVIQIALIDAPASSNNGQVSLVVLDNNGGNTPVSNNQF